MYAEGLACNAWDLRSFLACKSAFCIHVTLDMAAVQGLNDVGLLVKRTARGMQRPAV